MLDAAKAMKLSSKDLLELKVIDEIIPEPLGGAHRDRGLILINVREVISKNLKMYQEMSTSEILDQWRNKFLKIGREKGFITNPENLSSLENKRNVLDQILYKNNKKTFFVFAFILFLLILMIYSL